MRDLGALCDGALRRLADLEAQIIGGVAKEQRAPALSWIQQLTASLTLARQTATYVLERLSDIRQRAERFVRDADFSILYDEQRRLLFDGSPLALRHPLLTGEEIEIAVVARLHVPGREGERQRGDGRAEVAKAARAHE